MYGCEDRRRVCKKHPFYQSPRFIIFKRNHFTLRRDIGRAFFIWTRIRSVFFYRLIFGLSVSPRIKSTETS